MKVRSGWMAGYIALLGLFPGAILAHPHSFISLKTAPVIEDNAVTGLKMAWLMDELTSADLLYDAGDARPDSPVWKALAEEVMTNVMKQHYFTEVLHQGKRVAFAAEPVDYRLQSVGDKAMLTFILPFATPQPLAGARIQFSTFDPSFYVDMKYDRDRDAVLPAELAGECDISVVTPEPSESMLTFAASLDKDDAPPEDMALGKQFAQQVRLQCQ